MEYNEDDFLMLSGLSHFKFCRRRWALVHIENQWAENFRTVDGEIMHEHAHDESFFEKRGDKITTRAMPIFSRTLGVSGQCDVLEFHRDKSGVPLSGQEGLWLPFPVEYKRGAPNEFGADELQLCGQAMCLEEMLACKIGSGALFYGETRRRKPVEFTNELRDEVKLLLLEMHELYTKGYTPKCKRKKSCNACSLRELCLPELEHAEPVSGYISERIGAEL